MNIVELEKWVDAYIQAQQIEGIDGSHPLWWAIDKFMDAVQSNPELAWEAIVKIVQRRPSEKVLGMLSAGPLEDLLEQHGENFILRIEKISSADACFRKMLEHIWKSSTPEIWERLNAAKGKVDQ
jgi:hypothetical protein